MSDIPNRFCLLAAREGRLKNRGQSFFFLKTKSSPLWNCTIFCRKKFERTSKLSRGDDKQNGFTPDKGLFSLSSILNCTYSSWRPPIIRKRKYLLPFSFSVRLLLSYLISRRSVERKTTTKKKQRQRGSPRCILSNLNRDKLAVCRTQRPGQEVEKQPFCATICCQAADTPSTAGAIPSLIRKGQNVCRIVHMPRLGIWTFRFLLRILLADSNQ